MYMGEVFAPFTINPVEVRFTDQKPLTVSATTLSINAKGRIRGYNGEPGCIAQFKLSVFRRL